MSMSEQHLEDHGGCKAKSPKAYFSPKVGLPWGKGRAWRN